MIYEKILAEQIRLKQKLASIESQLASLPEGSLICSKNPNKSTEYYKWYQSDGHHKIYIPKSNLALAQQLALKKYLCTLKSELIQEQSAIEFYLRHHCTEPRRSSTLLTENSEFSRLLSPFFTPISQKLYNWSIEMYQKNPNHPEHLIHHGAADHLVRSKSEAIIDLLLYTNKIPYRYECALHLGDTIVYPDFTIPHPLTGVMHYWEHFGLMDDPTYSKNAYSKLQLYSSHGIIPFVNLIVTFETKQNPLSIDLVNKIIDYYFL